MHFPPKFLQKPSPPPIFFMVHLLHRLYGVDAPAQQQTRHTVLQGSIARRGRPYRYMYPAAYYKTVSINT